MCIEVMNDLQQLCLKYVSRASELIKRAMQRLSNREQELCLDPLCSPDAFQAVLECL